MRALGRVPTRLRAPLERALEGARLEVDEALPLMEARGDALEALLETADALRARQAGERITYVVNRNINFTNVCLKSCSFCAYARGHRSEQGYWLDAEEIERRAEEAATLGATEICVQAGLAPGMRAETYLEVVRAVRRGAPDAHIHAFSPEEIRHGAALGRMPEEAFLRALMAEGLGSLPGTAAEILDDAIRRRISPTRIDTASWIRVVETAHRLGLPTTATILIGHVESARDRLAHLALLRSIQEQSGGFTELVPLSFVHERTPLHARQGIVGPSLRSVLRLHAVARLMLGEAIPNLQASWVKEGPEACIQLLRAGANDLGGTLINESISTMAGAGHGERLGPAALRALARRAGRSPAERGTRYELLARFPLEGGADPPHPLDQVLDPEARFGSYEALASDPRLRWRAPASS